MADKRTGSAEPGAYASPPCFMHEVSDDGVSGTAARQDGWTDVARWRAAERKRLLAERQALSAEERQARSDRIARSLDRIVGKVNGRIISSYWPFRGEPDLRNWSIRIIERGGRIALPVVIRKGWPLEFRIWSPGDPLERGYMNILVPSRGPSVQPDVAIAPLVGFDAANFRLGYGGGFFDRTLAAMPRRAFVIGVGAAESRLATIYPQPHDIALDAIVTDE